MSCFRHNTINIVTHSAQVREKLMLSAAVGTAGKSTRIWNKTLAESDLSSHLKGLIVTKSRNNKYQDV
ncbi:hypothetical protein EB796_009427 [Bugula neritina]|uniref:Uncharacterized protein n=1 Tax=Bugula neritina TaxID=10212 RepID=A0A7J7K3X2_BUGNE|nr:hypothetical protein EB796_009427 [Bugula neritina]